MFISDLSKAISSSLLNKILFWWSRDCTLPCNWCFLWQNSPHKSHTISVFFFSWLSFFFKRKKKLKVALIGSFNDHLFTALGTYSSSSSWLKQQVIQVKTKNQLKFNPRNILPPGLIRQQCSNILSMMWWPYAVKMVRNQENKEFWKWLYLV